MSPPPENSLLSIPRELRNAVYAYFLEYEASDLISLLCTCRQILGEAKGFLYRRPLLFNHQRDLISFTIHAEEPLFRHVEDLSVRLHEVDIISATPGLVGRFVQNPVYNDATHPDHPHRREVGAITNALGRIGRQIKHLTILKPLNQSKTAPCDVFEGIFGWVKFHHERLETLQLRIEKMPLIFLPTMRTLKVFAFSGFSVTPPRETIDILNRMPCLEGLKLTGPPKHHDYHQRSGYRGQPIVQSITPQVLNQIYPLKEFSICELDDPYRDNAVLITRPMVEALRQRHSPTLTSLSVTANTTIEPKIAEAISNLLRACPNARHVELAWLEMDINILDSLPKNTRSLRLLAYNSILPQASVDWLRERSDSLPHLKSITFLQYVEIDDDDGDGDGDVRKMRLARVENTRTKAISRYNMKCTVNWQPWNPLADTY